MLHLPYGPFGFNAMQSSITGAPGGTSGTIVTPAVGSKGSWTQIVASLDHDTYGLVVCAQNNATAGANRSAVMDIAIGGAGSEQIIIPDLIASNANSIANPGGGIWYYFPMFIPAGTRISARAQGSVTTNIRVFIRAYQRPLNPAIMRSVGRVEVLGLSGIVGTTFTPGTAGEGAWALIGTTTQDNYWWQLGVQVTVSDVAFATNNIWMDLAHGDGTNYNIFASNLTWSCNTSEQCHMPLTLLQCEQFVPSGSNIYVRGYAAGTPEPMEAVVYGAG